MRKVRNLGLLLWICGCTIRAWGQAPDPLRGNVDETLFPQAYGVLASESLMFPLDQGDWPVKIDRTRQLFVDDYLIDSLENVSRRVNPAVKHRGNPLIDRDKPWEGNGCVWQQVLLDEQSGKFRMWYSCYNNITLPSGRMVRFPTCYAESDDGIHWQKPELGLQEYEGSTANNILILDGGLGGLFYEPHEPDPELRYKGIVWHDWRDPAGAPPEGYYLYASPDGIHWRQIRERPILYCQNREQTGIGDTSQFRWDERLSKYVCDTKVLFRRPATMRTRGMMESDDLVHWSRPRMTIYPDALDAPDAQIYGHQGFVYQSMWIGMLRLMTTERIADSYKQTSVELTSSRDGRHWMRVGGREELIALGPTDSWDPHYHDPYTPPLLVDDELWFYYRSMPLFDPELNPTKAASNKIARIGLAKLRRDGFVSMDAEDEPGRIVTRPLTFESGRLHVNAHVRDGGYLRAEVQDTEGNPIASLSMDECVKQTGDVLDGGISWQKEELIRCPQGESLRLAFELRNAKLYSFWIE